MLIRIERRDRFSPINALGGDTDLQSDIESSEFESESNESEDDELGDAAAGALTACIDDVIAGDDTITLAATGTDGANVEVNIGVQCEATLRCRCK